MKIIVQRDERKTGLNRGVLSIRNEVKKKKKGQNRRGLGKNATCESMEKKVARRDENMDASQLYLSKNTSGNETL